MSSNKKPVNFPRPQEGVQVPQSHIEPPSVLEEGDSNALNLVRQKLDLSRAEMDHAQLAYDLVAQFLTQKYSLERDDKVLPNGRIVRAGADAPSEASE